MSSERDRIAMLRRVFTPTASAVEVHIGDDAAVLKPTADNQVLSVDTAVDGVHFRREWLRAHDIGWKSFMAAASDLAAMGATPTASLLALTLPPDITDDYMRRMVRGVNQAAIKVGCPVIGGNLSGGTELSLTTTVIGTCAGAPLLRKGARIGDALCIGGTLGGAALGLAAYSSMSANVETQYSTFARRWSPEAQVLLGQQLLSVATSAIDTSDGLLQDLASLSPKTGFDVLLDTIPTDPGLHSAAQALGLEPQTLMLSGGEDYRLLFTCAEADVPASATVIGQVVGSPGIRVLDSTGQPVSVAKRGFDHYRLGA